MDPFVKFVNECKPIHGNAEKSLGGNKLDTEGVDEVTWMVLNFGPLVGRLKEDVDEGFHEIAGLRLVGEENWPKLVSENEMRGMEWRRGKAGPEASPEIRA